MARPGAAAQLPVDGIDRIVIPGINDADAAATDCMISAGSATTTALCLLLHVLSRSFRSSAAA